MATHDFTDIGDVLNFELLRGTIASLDSVTDTCTVTCGGATLTALLFYHCSTTSAMRNNGAIEGAAAGFIVGDEVIVLKRYDDTVVKVIGHVDGIRRCGGGNVVFVLQTDDTWGAYAWVLYLVSLSQNGYTVVKSCSFTQPSNAYLLEGIGYDSNNNQFIVAYRSTSDNHYVSTVNSSGGIVSTLLLFNSSVSAFFDYHTDGTYNFSWSDTSKNANFRKYTSAGALVSSWSTVLLGGSGNYSKTIKNGDTYDVLFPVYDYPSSKEYIYYLNEADGSVIRYWQGTIGSGYGIRGILKIGNNLLFQSQRDGASDRYWATPYDSPAEPSLLFTVDLDAGRAAYVESASLYVLADGSVYNSVTNAKLYSIAEITESPLFKFAEAISETAV